MFPTVYNVKIYRPKARDLEGKSEAVKGNDLRSQRSSANSPYGEVNRK